MPTADASVASGPRTAPLPPLCGLIGWSGGRPAGFDPNDPCPTDFGPGVYASMIVGESRAWAFTLRLLSSDLVAAAGAADWLQLANGSAGLSVFGFPTPVGDPEMPTAALREWLRDRPGVRKSNERSTSPGGITGWQLDLTPLAPLPTTGCRVQAPCLPLVTARLAGAGPYPPLAAAELHQGVTSRLWVSEDPSVPDAVWVWDFSDAETAAVVASIRFV